MFIVERLDSVSLLPYLFASLFSNSAMAFGIDIILRREATAEGDVYCHKGQIKIQVIFLTMQAYTGRTFLNLL
jgi:hypothetical protein